MSESSASPENEISVLGSILIDNEAIEEVHRILTPVDFFNQSHRLIFEAMLELFSNGEPIDLSTLTDELRRRGQLEAVGMPPYLIGLMDSTPTAAYAVHYAERVKEASRLRTIESVAAQAMQQARDGNLSSESLLNRLSASIQEMSRAGQKQKEDEARIFEMAEKYADGDAFVSTGFPTLDRKIGGLPRGDLCYIGARNSHGKGMMLYSIAPTVANNERAAQVARGEEPNAFVYVISPDQHPAQIVALEASRQSGVPLLELMRRNPDGSHFVPLKYRQLWREKLRAVRTNFWDLVRIRKGGVSVLQIEELCVDAIRRGACMIAVDTIQRVSARSDASKGVDTIGRVSEVLKDLAGDFDIPVLILSQIRREVDSRPLDDGDGRKPNPDDMANGPTVIGNDAATMLLLYNHARYVPPHPMQERGPLPLLINVAKNKSGQAGGWGGLNDVSLQIQPEFTRVFDPIGGHMIQKVNYDD